MRTRLNPELELEQSFDKALKMRVAKHNAQKKAILLKSKIDSKARPIVAWAIGSAKKPYEIKAHERYGLSCNCPSWIFNQRGDRTCKHTDEIGKQVEVI